MVARSPVSMKVIFHSVMSVEWSSSSRPPELSVKSLLRVSSYLRK
jgi:hypothetical protein